MMCRILKTFVVMIFLLFFLFLFFSVRVLSMFLVFDHLLHAFASLIIYGRFLGRRSQRRVSLFKNLMRDFLHQSENTRERLSIERSFNISPIVSLSLHFARSCCFLLSVDKRKKHAHTQIRVWYIIITRARTCLHSR